MARPSNVARYVISGHLAQGETFAWGFWMNEAPDTQPDTQTAADVVSSYFTTYLGGTAKSLISPLCGYDMVDCYSYMNPSPAGATHHAQAAIVGGTGTGTDDEHPLQCSLVFSLRTGSPGGRHRGRFFLPVNTVVLTAHQLTQAQLTTYNTEVTHFLQEVNDSGPGLPGLVAVVSPTYGLTTPVNLVTCDSRLDIQRRRAEQEAELFQSSLALVAN